MGHRTAMLPDKGGELLGDLRPVAVGQTLGDHPLRHELHQLPDQRIDVAVVVIEGVAVDAALLDDVLDGDFIQRALVQQLDEGFDDGLSGKG